MRGGKILIQLDDVWKTYKMGKSTVEALRGLSLDINEGDFLVIMGPSGSGKSTAMHVIGCLDIPTKGKLLLEGQNIAHLTESELANIRGRKMGFIFQQFNLIQTLTASENVELPMIFQGIPKKEREKKALELLKAVGLKDRAKHKPTEMSGGEQQRIAIARALVNDPKIILADEPTGNLDSKTGRMVMQTLIDLHNEQNKTIVIVTHDPAIASYAERTVNLVDGRIAHDHETASRYLWKNGKPKKGYKSDNKIRRFDG